MALWTPAQITSFLWLDADDASTITESAGAVSQWDDKSGNANHMVQATTANKPITGTRTINSLNTLDFDGTNHDMSASLSPAPAATTHTFIFCLIEFDAVSNPSIMDLYGDDRLSPRLGFQQHQMFRNAAASSGDTSIISASPNPTIEIFSTDYNASTDTYDLWYTANVKATAATFSSGAGLSATFTNAFIGDDSTGSNRVDGTIAEIIVAKDLTVAERELVEGYLAWKWGIEANLPSGHPYEDAAPLLGGGVGPLIDGGLVNNHLIGNRLIK